MLLAMPTLNTITSLIRKLGLGGYQQNTKKNMSRHEKLIFLEQAKVENRMQKLEVENPECHLSICFAHFI